MHLVPRIDTNPENDTLCLADVKKKRAIDIIDELLWNHNKEFKKEYGIPWGLTTLEIQEEKRNSVRLFLEEKI